MMNHFIEANNGMRIPQLGFGSFDIAEEMVQSVIQWAVDAGYRNIDTATRYENERSVGQALKKCGVARADLFVVSKIWPTAYDKPVRAIEFSLKQLDLDYLDAYLLHWPSSSEDRRYRAWEALLTYREKGWFRSVGVSNFTAEQLQKLTDKFGVVPIMNQIELHPWFQQRDLRAYCQARNIAISAWGPIFRGLIHEVPLLAELGLKYGKSPVQVALRWHIQHQHAVIPRSTNRERIFANTQIFDFALSDEDMSLIDALENGRHFGGDPNTNDGANFTMPEI